MLFPSARFTQPVPTLILFVQWLIPPLFSVIVLYLCLYFFSEEFEDKYFLLSIASLLLSTIYFTDSPLNKNFLQLSYLKISRLILLNWLGVAGTLGLFSYLTNYYQLFSFPVILSWIILTPLLVCLLEVLTHKFLSHALVSGRYYRRAVITGRTAVGKKLAECLLANTHYGIQFVGFFDDRTDARSSDTSGDYPHLGNLDSISQYLATKKVDINFITLPYLQDKRVLSLINDLQDSTTSIYVVPNLAVADFVGPHVDEIDGIPVYALRDTPLRGINALLKRSFDFMFAATAILLLSPVLAIIAIALKLTTKGSVIFQQARYGLDGSKFTIYKFRSMTVSDNGDQISQATQNDTRITRLGAFLRKTSLDELPQLFNVLSGSMSLVGPRPHAVAHNEEYRQIICSYMVRHTVKPGLTGWAQIHGFRGETKEAWQMQLRIKHDLEYIKHWSIFLDIKIILLTFWVVFTGKNAY